MAFLEWCIDHRDRLTWRPGATYSQKTPPMRRALLYDEPPARAQAQTEARKLLRKHGPKKNDWWRFGGGVNRVRRHRDRLRVLADDVAGADG